MYGPGRGVINRSYSWTCTRTFVEYMETNGSTTQGIWLTPILRVAVATGFALAGGDQRAKADFQASLVSR